MDDTCTDLRPRLLDRPTFGAVVTGRRLTEIDEAAFAWLYSVWLDRALLIFPGQHLTRDEQVALRPPLRAAGVRDRLVEQRAARTAQVRATAEGDEVEDPARQQGLHHDNGYAVQAAARCSPTSFPPKAGDIRMADMRVGVRCARQRFIQASTVAYHWTEFCGLSTKWFSSGK